MLDTVRRFLQPTSMPTPTLKDRQDLWLWTYANHCFTQVVAACNFFLSPPATPVPKAIHRLVIAGAIATYGKPFTHWKGVGRLDESIVPRVHMSIHQELMDLRHMLIAHVDAERFQADDPTFGNINQVRLSMTKEHHEIMVTDVAVEFPRPDKAKQLSEYLESEMLQKMRGFAEAYIADSCLPSGEYRLNIDPKELRAFVPAAPLGSHQTPFRRN